MNSIKIFDLIKLLDLKAKIKTVGIRPGEKMHESLFSIDECRLVNQDKESFIIYSENLSFTSKYGKRLKNEIEYSSSNGNVLNIKKIKHFLDDYFKNLKIHSIKNI